MVAIKLDEPVIVQDVTYNELIFGKFKTKHYKFIPAEMFDFVEEEMTTSSKIKMGLDMIPLVAAMANVSEEVIGELDVSDFNKVVEAIGPLLEGSLKIGKK